MSKQSEAKSTKRSFASKNQNQRCFDEKFRFAPLKCNSFIAMIASTKITFLMLNRNHKTL